MNGWRGEVGGPVNGFVNEVGGVHGGVVCVSVCGGGMAAPLPWEPPLSHALLTNTTADSVLVFFFFLIFCKC